MPDRLFAGRITRRLRFRVTAVYLVFFAVVLLVVGIFFDRLLGSSQLRLTSDLLEEHWNDLQHKMRVGPEGLDWHFASPCLRGARARKRPLDVLFVADGNGRIIEVSPAYGAFGIDLNEHLQKVVRTRKPAWRIVSDSHLVPYLIRFGVFEGGNPLRRYYIVMGRPLDSGGSPRRKFILAYLAATPLLILAAGLIGWFWFGRALRPIQDLAIATRRIGGSNLSFRIPERGAGDELDQLTRTFNQMIERLEQSFRQMKQFTNDVSHELRTPVTAARGQLEVALYTARTTEEYREAIGGALEEVERLGRFVQGMLSLSLAESGQLALRREQIDVAEIAHSIAEQFSIPAEEARVTLSVEAPESLAAEVDRLLFERLVSNLFSNAIKYTPPEGKVTLRLAAVGDFVELIVEDTGCGIPAEHLPRIFDRLYRVPGEYTARKRGLGLGLSFVSWIVQAHDGKIHVDSAVGKGSRFTVALPLRAQRDGGVKPGAA